MTKPSPAVDFDSIKPGTILEQRFLDIKIRYIFICIEKNKLITLIPIFTKKNTGEKWHTALYKMFSVSPQAEQFIPDLSTFDLERFLEKLRSETEQ